MIQVHIHDKYMYINILERIKYKTKITGLLYLQK